jgi:hypothetical protein
MNAYGRDTFVAFGEASGTTLFLGRAGGVYAPQRLMAAQTRVPGSELGIVFFAGDPHDPWQSLRTDVNLFRIQGIGLR